MTRVPSVPRRPLDRPAFLRRRARRASPRGAGVPLPLPLLDAMMPARGRARAGAAEAVPRRLVAIQTTQGIMPHLFFPEQAGEAYTPSPYLELLADRRRDFT